MTTPSATWKSLIDAGCTSFKAFVGNTFGNLPAPTDGALLEGFEKLAPLGIRTVVHAENSSILLPPPEAHAGRRSHRRVGAFSRPPGGRRD
ncbi:hypothetical protein ULG90_20815 [Halopseudomonas pachastrellae]|nr:hypothetical protein ULG90_20815 [Halopseudomonas pachastrellae]